MALNISQKCWVEFCKNMGTSVWIANATTQQTLKLPTYAMTKNKKFSINQSVTPT
jgi:hypothetical protein